MRGLYDQDVVLWPEQQAARLHRDAHGETVNDVEWGNSAAVPCASPLETVRVLEFEGPAEPLPEQGSVAIDDLIGSDARDLVCVSSRRPDRAPLHA
jgi:hypothetical protein